MKKLIFILLFKFLLVGDEDFLGVDDFENFNNYEEFNNFSEFNEFNEFNQFNNVASTNDLGIDEISADGIKKTNIHQKTIVKNRAKRNTSDRNLYLYVNDRDVRYLNLYSHRRTNQVVNIASPVIDDRSRVNKVNIVVDLDRNLKIKKNRYNQNNIVNIGSPEIDNNSIVKELDILVETSKIEIE